MCPAGKFLRGFTATGQLQCESPRIVVDFDSLERVDDTFLAPPTPYEEDGLLVTTAPGQATVYGRLSPNYYGSTAIHTINAVNLSRPGGGAFNFLSVDLAGSVIVDGTKEDGSFVQTSLFAPYGALRTVRLPDSFSGVTSVSFRSVTTGFTIIVDAIVVSGF